MKIVNSRDGSTREFWDADDLAKHLNIETEMAKKYFKDYHGLNGGGYGDIEKSLILDFVNQKQREEREREARHQSDLSNVESLTYLKEQVKFLKENVGALDEQTRELRAMNRSNENSSSRAAFLSILSIIVSAISTIVSVLALIFAT